MLDLNLKYCEEEFDRDGSLKSFRVNCPEDFNFAYDIVDVIAEATPDRRAMLWTNEDGEERTFTFEEMKRFSNKAANVFTAHGIQKGDKVVLVLKRHYQFWFAILGLHKIGAVAIPGTHLLTKKDLVYRFNASGAKAIVATADGEVSDYVDQAQKESPTLLTKLMAKGSKQGWFDFDEELEKASDVFQRMPVKKSDMMLLYFTSGTSGHPKMVAHDFSYPLGHIITAKHWLNVIPDGLHLTLAETGWGKAVWGKLYGQWIMEAGIFVYDFEKFVPSDLLRLIEKYKITTFCAPPTIYRFFIKEGMKNFDLSSLQHASIAGEALNPEVYNRFYSYTGIKLMESYGQTESTVLVGNLTGMEPKPGSMGRPSPAYDIALIGLDGKPVETGEVGEIVVKTEKEKPCGLFDGYYLDETRTSEVWNNGIYHTRDTAWQDEDGYLWYVGRTDDVIKSSGYRIGPFEIESVLMEHDAVLECAVTGVPDPIRGQVVKATIVLTKNYAPSEELKKDIQNYVKKSTAPYKYPRIVEFVEELPKTISGKIRRVEIRQKDEK